MNKFCALLFVTMVATSSAFAPPLQSTKLAARTPVAAFVRAEQPTTALKMAEDMSWEGEYPPSKVLGPIMSKMPSGVLGLVSLVLLGITGYSCYMSGQLQNTPGALNDGSWVKWYYVLGSFMGPLSWGTHVACWIQRKNGL